MTKKIKACYLRTTGGAYVGGWNFLTSNRNFAKLYMNFEEARKDMVGFTELPLLWFERLEVELDER